MKGLITIKIIPEIKLRIEIPSTVAFAIKSGFGDVWYNWTKAETRNSLKGVKYIIKKKINSIIPIIIVLETTLKAGSSPIIIDLDIKGPTVLTKGGTIINIKGNIETNQNIVKPNRIVIWYLNSNNKPNALKYITTPAAAMKLPINNVKTVIHTKWLHALNLRNKYPNIKNPTKFAGTPAINAKRGVVNPKGVRNKISPIKEPKAAPKAATYGPDTIAKKAGITTPGLIWPIPHGVEIGAVKPMDIAYKAAHIAVNAIL